MVRYLLIAMVAVETGVFGWSQTLRSTLFAAINATDYLGETYTERPKDGASYVQFEGETVRFLITISNPTNDEELLRLSPFSPGSAFDLHFTRDGEAVPIGFTVQDGVSALAESHSCQSSLQSPSRCRHWSARSGRWSFLIGFRPGNIEPVSSQTARTVRDAA